MATAVGILADSYVAPGGGGWTPASLTGLQLWLDASDSGTVTDAGAGAVSQWSDKSGGAHHFTQATGATRPTTGTRTINGLNAIEFTAGPSRLDHTWTAVLAQPVTIAAVVLTDATAAGICRVIGRGSTSTFNFGRSSAACAYAAGTARSASTLTIGQAHMLVGFFDGTGSRLRKDGAQIHDATSNAVGTNGLSDGGTLISIGANATAALWDGLIAEIVIVNTNLNGTGDLTSLESYLETKWATP